MFVWTMVKRILGSFLVICGLLTYGMKGLLVGYILYIWFCYFVNIGLVSKHIGYYWKRQLLDLLPIGFVSVLFFLVTYLGVNAINIENIYLDGISKVCVFASLYLVWSLVFKPESYLFACSVIPSRFKFWERS